MAKFTVLKSDEKSPYHYVEGVVYTPMAVDAHGDAILPFDVEMMAHDFVANGFVNKIDTQHDNVLNGAEVVESFIARKDDPDYHEGSWVLKVRMTEDNPIWTEIKKGTFNGFSLQAFAKRVPQKVMVDLVRIANGETESNLDPEDTPVHTHEFYLELNSEGKVTLGATSEVNGHTHQILTLTATEKSGEHSHRFFI